MLSIHPESGLSEQHLLEPDLNESFETFNDEDDGEQRGEVSKKKKNIGEVSKKKKIVLDSESEIEYGDVSYHDYEDDTEQNIGEIDADLFSPNYLSKAELRHLENIRS